MVPRVRIVASADCLPIFEILIEQAAAAVATFTHAVSAPNELLGTGDRTSDSLNNLFGVPKPVIGKLAVIARPRISNL